MQGKGQRRPPGGWRPSSPLPPTSTPSGCPGTVAPCIRDCNLSAAGLRAFGTDPVHPTVSCASGQASQPPVVVAYRIDDSPHPTIMPTGLPEQAAGRTRPNPISTKSPAGSCGLVIATLTVSLLSARIQSATKCRKESSTFWGLTRKRSAFSTTAGSSLPTSLKGRAEWWNR